MKIKACSRLGFIWHAPHTFDGAVIRAIYSDRPPYEVTDATPVYLSSLLRQCWSKNPEERPSAQDICNLLESPQNYPTWLSRYHAMRDIHLANSLQLYHQLTYTLFLL